MPIYEYVCGSCEARFEKLVRRFGESVACPSCASDEVDRQLSVFAVAVSASAPAPANCAAGACSPQAGCGQGACGSGACGMLS